MKLDLQHNELSHIPRCLLELPSLGELNLAHNSLEEIPDVVEWSPCLTVLDLSHNQLSSLPSNVIVPAIRALNLSHNYFRKVPQCICSFTTLHSLNLSENPDILQLPAEMGRLSQLSRLGLNGLTDLNDPPRSVQKDAQHCIRYLHSKLRCAKGFYKMKLMLVGQANRGKTTLVARLQGRDCGDESTVGVDVSEWSYKPSLGNKKFYYSIWDFGGQEEYYATHQCFLSEKSLYLLLFNIKHKEKGVQELKPWLNNIAMRAPNSLVIIVGTHLDEVSEDERAEVDETLQNAGNLASRFTHKLKIPQILPVGLTGRIENIGLLKDAIYNHSAEYTHRRGQPIMGQLIPASYHALDKQLESLQEEIRAEQAEPIMNSEQFKAMVLSMSLPDLQNDEELKTATLFLTDIGSLLHYDDRSHNLNELYFVHPRWLCDMMAKVVTIKERNPFVKRGILYSKDIRFLFRDKRFPWQHFEQYLTLLDRFEIALPLDNRRVLIPSMLPVSHPEELNCELEQLFQKPLYTRYIIFTKSTTPPGFWSRLLSRIMHSVQKVVLALNTPATTASSEFQDVPTGDDISPSVTSEMSTIPEEEEVATTSSNEVQSADPSPPPDTTSSRSSILPVNTSLKDMQSTDQSLSSDYMQSTNSPEALPPTDSETSSETIQSIDPSSLPADSETSSETIDPSSLPADSETSSETIQSIDPSLPADSETSSETIQSIDPSSLPVDSETSSETIQSIDPSSLPVDSETSSETIQSVDPSSMPADSETSSETIQSVNPSLPADSETSSDLETIHSIDLSSLPADSETSSETIHSIDLSSLPADSETSSETIQSVDPSLPADSNIIPSEKMHSTDRQDASLLPSVSETLPTEQPEYQSEESLPLSDSKTSNQPEESFTLSDSRTSDHLKESFPPSDSKTSNQPEESFALSNSRISDQPEESLPLSDSITSDSHEESLLPVVSDPLPVDDTDTSFTFPCFPSQLPITQQESYPNKDIQLYFWREGLFYKDPGVMFRVESLSASRSTRKKGDGVLLSGSPSNEGKKIIAQLVDIVLALVQEWYPGIIETSHGSEIEQRVLCIECMRQGRARPFEFHVDHCLKVFAKNELTMECGFHKLDPTRNHTVLLTDIVPDMLLQDIDTKFLLKKEDIIYEENDSSLLGKGGYGKVYRGKCHGKEVAIKKYHNSTEEAFTELRVEAKLLQQSHHPCFVCLEGVCVYPIMALVLELAPLGSLSFPLLKKKVPIHRLTIFRIALEVAAALRFIHQQGIVFRDLKADNVLLWTLNPDSLCHCKVTDFGIATHLSPVGVKGLKGTKGFIAPEVLHIDKRKQRSGYDHKADTFSFAMLLYQMIARRHPYHDVQAQRIDAYIEMGERPKLSDIHNAQCAFSYLTKLMQTCWRDNPRRRPGDDVLISKLSLPVLQCTMAVTSIKSHLSPRKAIAIPLENFAKAGARNQLTSELWVCCDGAEGVEINMFSLNNMAKVKNTFISDTQVQAIVSCSDHVWISSRAGIDYSVVDIFCLQTKELIHNIRIRDICVACMASTNDAVYIGTIEGYCFRFPVSIEEVRNNVEPMHRHVSKHAIDGIACTKDCVWISHTKNIYFINLNSLKHQGSLHRDDNTYLGQLSLSPDRRIIWSAHLNGATFLSAWDAEEKRHCFDVDTNQHLLKIAEGVTERDRIITAMVPAEDCVWVGMATGHILVFFNEELLTWFHPYTEYVRFLTLIPCSGPCEMEKCMVASGGKGFQSMIKDLEQTVTSKLDDKDQGNEDEDDDGKGGYLVVWEAFQSTTYRQINLINQRSPEMFDNHNTVSQAIREGRFVDGTNLLNTDTPKSHDQSTASPTNYAHDLDAKPYHDPNYDTPPGTSDSFESSSEQSNSLTNQASSNGTSQSPDTPASNPLPAITTGRRRSSAGQFRQRTTTVVSSSIRVSSDEVFDVKLLSNQQVVRITCSSPPQLAVVLSQLQVNASVSKEDCRLVYFNGVEEVCLKSQLQFTEYLKLRKRPQLLLDIRL